MAEVTTNFRDSGQGDLGKNLVSKDYLLSVYPKIADQIVPSVYLSTIAGTRLGVFLRQSTPLYTPVNFLSKYYKWKSLSSPRGYTSGSSDKLGIVKSDGTLWLMGVGGVFGFDPSTSTPLQEASSSTNWKSVEIGNNNSFAIKIDGTLWGWGSNSYGQLGTGDNLTRPTPVQEFTSSTNWKQVVCGDYHTAAIKTDGTLWTWGRNTHGQLGIDEIGGFRDPITNTFVNRTARSTPVRVGIDNKWEQIICLSNQGGYAPTWYDGNQGINVALKNDGTLWGWGTGGGRGFFHFYNNPRTILTPSQFDISPGYFWKTVPTTITAENSPISIHSSISFGIRNDNTFWWWGKSEEGFNSYIYAPVNNHQPFISFGQEWTSSTNWRQIVAGGISRNVAIKTDGTLWGWANLNYNVNTAVAGVFATGLQMWKTPYLINSSTDWRQASVGFIGAAVKTDNTLWTWGYSVSSSSPYPGLMCLGAGGISHTTPQQEFTSSSNWKEVVVKANTAIALKTDGTLWSWGQNNYGQLGINDTIPRSTPVQEFTSSTNWSQVCINALGQYVHAIKSTGELWAWGRNYYGNFFGVLGTNDAFGRITPVRIGLDSTWKYVSSGYNHSAALKTDGTLWTWGSNDSGQLGKNETIGRSSPVQESSSSTNWNFVACGNSTTLALKNDGSLWGWGSNIQGCAGRNNWKTDYRMSPVQEYTGSADWSYVVGQSSSSQGINQVNNIIYGVKSDGVLWSLSKYGSTGTSFNDDPPGPISSNWNRVFIGPTTNYGIKTDGTLWMWGRGSNGDSFAPPFAFGGILGALSPVQESTRSSNWKYIWPCSFGVVAEVSNA